MNPEQKYQSFEEFWPFYLSQHSHPICRMLHIVGTSLSILFLIYCLFGNRPLWIPLVPLIGYGFAWVGHFGFEKNRPATFTYPKWSFLGDFKMLVLFYQGKLDQELTRFKIQ